MEDKHGLFHLMEEHMTKKDKKDEVKFEIINNIGVISENQAGWKKELNRISWSGMVPKYDIRAWSADHTKMGKGVTLSEDEIRELSNILNQEIKFLDED